MLNRYVIMATFYFGLHRVRSVSGRNIMKSPTEQTDETQNIKLQLAFSKEVFLTENQNL